jgi:hypothetical protein
MTSIPSMAARKTAVFHFATGRLRMTMFDRTPKITGEWECMECGYIEEGVGAQRPKECPECGAPADAFDFFSYVESDEEDWDSDDLEGDEDEEDDEYDEDFEDEDRY